MEFIARAMTLLPLIARNWQSPQPHNSKVRPVGTCTSRIRDEV